MHDSIVIIGAGPAGCAAAVQCQRLGIRPLLLDASGRAGGLVINAYCIENYPGLDTPLRGPAFVARLLAHLARFDLSVERATVLKVEPGDSCLQIATDGGAVTAIAVIAAPGTEPVRLDDSAVEGIEGELLFYEVHDLLERLPEPGEVVVVGSGDAACDYALSLARAGARVRLIIRGQSPHANPRLDELVRREERIRLTTGLTLQAVERAGDALEMSFAGATDRVSLRADALLVAIGRRSVAPRLLHSLAPADSSVLTRVPGLFIAGDARTGVLGQVGMAVGDGLEAAAAAVALVEADRCSTS